MSFLITKAEPSTVPAVAVAPLFTPVPAAPRLGIGWLGILLSGGNRSWSGLLALSRFFPGSEPYCSAKTWVNSAPKKKICAE